MTTTAKRAAVAALGAAMALSATIGEARVYASAARNGNFKSTVPQPVPLDADGGTSLTFRTKQDKAKVAIAFSAECSNNAAERGVWTDIDVKLDGVAVKPTNQLGDVLCASNGTAGFDHFVMVSLDVAVVVETAGVHTVEIVARSSDGTSAFWVSDVSTIVYD